MTSRRGRWDRFAAPVAFALGLMVQLQATPTLADTPVRVSLADPLLVLLSPLVIFVLLSERGLLLEHTGRAIPALILLASAALGVSFLIGWQAAGHITPWALVKFTGWFVLLGYLALGLALGLAASGRARQAFALGLILGLLITALLYLALNTFSESRDWIVNFEGSLRLQGFSENPNAFGFLALVSAVLAVAYRETLARHAGGGSAVAITGVLLAAVLLSGSMAAMGALLVIATAAAMLGLVRPRNALAVTLVALAVTILPNIGPVMRATPPVSPEAEGSSRGFAALAERLMSQFAIELELVPRSLSKLLAITELKTAGEYGRIAQRTRDARVSAFSGGLALWREHPLLGGGLGTYLREEGARYADIPPAERPPPVMIHSTPLWLLAEAGLLGLAAFGALFVGFFAWLAAAARAPTYRHDCARPFVIAALFILMTWAVMALAHEFMYQRLLWLVAGLAIAPLQLPVPAGDGNARAA